MDGFLLLFLFLKDVTWVLFDFFNDFRFKSNEGVIVIGATNFAEALDK